MKTSDLISGGLCLLIPVGFLIKVFFNVHGMSLFIIMASLVVCVITFSLIQKSTAPKKGQIYWIWLQPLIMFPSLYLIYSGVDPSNENKIHAVSVMLVITAFTTLIFLLGVKAGSSNK